MNKTILLAKESRDNPLFAQMEQLLSFAESLNMENIKIYTDGNSAFDAITEDTAIVVEDLDVVDDFFYEIDSNLYSYINPVFNARFICINPSIDIYLSEMQAIHDLNYLRIVYRNLDKYKV